MSLGKAAAICQSLWSNWGRLVWVWGFRFSVLGLGPFRVQGLGCGDHEIPKRLSLMSKLASYLRILWRRGTGPFRDCSLQASHGFN